MCGGKKEWTDITTETFTKYPVCPYCEGTGFEPVEVENPECEKCSLTFKFNKIPREECQDCKSTGYKLQVAFDVDKNCDGCDLTHQKCLDSPKTGHIKCCPDCNDKRLKFLPLRQKVKGDNSILMVVKVNG